MTYYRQRLREGVPMLAALEYLRLLAEAEAEMAKITSGKAIDLLPGNAPLRG